VVYTAFAVALALMASSSTPGSRRQLLSRMFWIMVPQAAISGWTTWRLRPTASHDLTFLRRVELGAIAAVILTNFSALHAVVMKCLAKRPEDRYASAAELERALAA
jgi:hypothetical protein